MKFTILSHAGLGVEHNGIPLVCDPWRATAQLVKLSPMRPSSGAGAFLCEQFSVSTIDPFGST